MHSPPALGLSDDRAPAAPAAQERGLISGPSQMPATAGGRSGTLGRLSPLPNGVDVTRDLLQV